MTGEGRKWVDLPPTLSASSRPAHSTNRSVGDAPGRPLQFSDVIEELGTIASLSTVGGGVSAEAVGLAARRAESLLIALRTQFLEDVVL
ncbi:MAG: hypothetical protein H0W94_03045 [Actinobacteria bacterium]|nr:hypothetical protein [Actinomycetota bacterium]